MKEHKDHLERIARLFDKNSTRSRGLLIMKHLVKETGCFECQKPRWGFELAEDD